MLAFSLFVSLIPVALGVLSLYGLVTRDPKRFAAVRLIIVDIFPPDLHGPVRQALHVAGSQAGTIIVVSLLGLMWFSTGLFSTTGFALNQIHGFPNRSFWRQRALGLLLAAALVVAVTAVVGINLGADLLALPRWVSLVGVGAALTVLVLFMYRRAPSRVMPWSRLLPGAAIAAVAIVLGGYGLTLTTTLTFQLGTDTRFFAQVFGLAAWVYFIAQSILFGAVVNRCLVEERRPKTIREVVAPARVQT